MLCQKNKEGIDLGLFMRTVFMTSLILISLELRSITIRKFYCLQNRFTLTKD